AAINRPFSWPLARDLRTLKVGFIEDGKAIADRRELVVLRELGVQLVPLKLHVKQPLNALRLILTAESAAAFDDITRKGITEGLNTWPDSFRRGQFIPAVEYLRANRLRTLLIRDMEEALAPVDVLMGGDTLLWSNLTGHPALVLP